MLRSLNKLSFKQFGNHQLQARAFAYTTLPANTNQAEGLAEYAVEFMQQDNKKISDNVYERARLFHTDSVLCGISAIALRTNAPNLLRREAIKQYPVNKSANGTTGEK